MAEKSPSGISWRKSSASASGGAVEVAVTSNSVLLRNSRDPVGSILEFSRAEWMAFLVGVRAGEFAENDLENGELSTGRANPTADDGEIIITIYLSDESAHEQVETAVEEWLNDSGIEIENRGNPVVGSWFNYLKARMAAREVAVSAVHAAEARLVLAQDAANTATLGQVVAPIIGSLQPTQEAVIRIGALLIVKFDGKVVVHQLTTDQQFKLDHQPQLARLPAEILSKLELE